MRLGKLFFLLIIIISFLTGCSSAETASNIEQAKPVKVKKLRETNTPITLDYIGTIESKEIKKYSFKVSGKIDKIFVNKGQQVKKGEQLAKLDTEDLSFAVDAAKAQLDGAKAHYQSALNGATTEQIKQAELNVKKAKDGLEYVQKQYDRMSALYENGAVSKNDLEKIELEKEKVESDLQIANQVLEQTKKGLTSEEKNAIKAEVNQAQVNYQQKKNMLDNAIILADMDGYIADLLYKEGEMVNAGYPVVLTRNKTVIATVGVTSDDLSKISVGTKAIVKTGTQEIEGKIVTIKDIPDQQTRTYNVEIEVPASSSLVIGSIVDVSFVIDQKTGIWIPITSIMANGEDYVFIVENNKAVKRKVVIGEMKDTNVFVQGLKPSDQLVIEGMNSITQGENLKIEE